MKIKVAGAGSSYVPLINAARGLQRAQKVGGGSKAESKTININGKTVDRKWWNRLGPLGRNDWKRENSP
jgi:hypothetical protein